MSAKFINLILGTRKWILQMQMAPHFCFLSSFSIKVFHWRKLQTKLTKVLDTHLSNSSAMQISLGYIQVLRRIQNMNWVNCLLDRE